MILKEILLKNFRQFKNDQKIKFACNPENKNVTVILGQIGRGKTGIYRAIMFCLYGDRILSQDGDTSEKEIHLVNTSALQESKSIGEPVETFVQLNFDHKGKKYSIKRTILGMIDGDKIIEEFGDLILYITEETGNTRSLRDPKDIAEVINTILDYRVREYFLFDGEKIERLTRASSDQKREISKGIRNLLNIDSLETSIKALKRVRKKLDNELANNSSGDLAKIIKLLNDNIDKQERKEKELEQIGEEYDRAFSEKSDIDKRLDEYGEIAGLIKERKELEQQAQERESSLNDNNVKMCTQIGKASFLLINQLVSDVYNNIDQRKKRGEIPSEIRRELIEKILYEKVCICKRRVEPGSEEFKAIIEWKNKTANIALQDVVLEVWRHLSTIKSRQGDSVEIIESIIQKHGVDQNALEEARRKIKSISDRIGNDVRKDAVNLEDHRKLIEKDLVALEAKRQVTEGEIASLVEENKELKKQRKELEKKEGLVGELKNRADLASRSHEALTSIYKEFTDDVRISLGAKATDIMAMLLSEHSRKNLGRIEIAENYSLQVFDKWQKPFLPNISQGERQLTSISFITALAKAASGNQKLEMPLFMDTPFGRLSYEPRRNLINVIPKETTQWILLATDTEFRRQEADLLKKSGNWGYFYTLETTEDGSTTILNRNIQESMQLLNDEIED